MNALHTLAPAEMAFDVLKFMRRNVQNFSMLTDMLDADMERWYTMSPDEQRLVFDRQRRRFEMACPGLAKKDRVQHAAESLGTPNPLNRGWRSRRNPA
jgi:hypothetical protein